MSTRNLKSAILKNAEQRGDINTASGLTGPTESTFIRRPGPRSHQDLEGENSGSIYMTEGRNASYGPWIEAAVINTGVLGQFLPLSQSHRLLSGDLILREALAIDRLQNPNATRLDPASLFFALQHRMRFMRQETQSDVSIGYPLPLSILRSSPVETVANQYISRSFLDQGEPPRGSLIREVLTKRPFLLQPIVGDSGRWAVIMARLEPGNPELAPEVHNQVTQYTIFPTDSGDELEAFLDLIDIDFRALLRALDLGCFGNAKSDELVRMPELGSEWESGFAAYALLCELLKRLNSSNFGPAYVDEGTLLECMHGQLNAGQLRFEMLGYAIGNAMYASQYALRIGLVAVEEPEGPELQRSEYFDPSGLQPGYTSPIQQETSETGDIDGFEYSQDDKEYPSIEM